MLWKFSPERLLELNQSKFNTRSNDHDIFFDDYPIIRKEIPLGWFTYMNSWQAKVGCRFLNQFNVKNEKRRYLANQLFIHLNDITRSYFPKSAFNMKLNFYHLPFKVNQKNEELLNLFKEGIDSEGYGLNLCSEEKIFKFLNSNTPNANMVKHSSVFLPLHESYTKNQMIKMANSLNELYTETYEAK